MRRIAVISGLLCMTMISSAQAISYSYDVSGNRTERTRTIVLHSSRASAVESQADSLISMQDSIGAMRFAVKASYRNGSIAVDIENAGDPKNLSYTLYNVSGQKLSSLNGGASALFDLSAYPNGVYMIVVSDGKEQNTWKVIKE